MTAPESLPPAPFTAALEPFPVADRLPGLPTPLGVRQGLAEQFNAAVQAERDRRGEVTRPSDTWPMVRAVEGFADLVDSYARALGTVAKDSRKVLEEELLEAVGEQDGIPTGRLSVPDLDGTVIGVRAKTDNAYDFDLDQVLGAVAAFVALRWERDPSRPTPEQAPEGFALACMHRLLEMFGKAPLKVSHVRALATELGQQGEDALAQVVSDAITKRVIYRGVAVERKEAS